MMTTERMKYQHDFQGRYDNSNRVTNYRRGFGCADFFPHAFAKLGQKVQFGRKRGIFGEFFDVPGQ